MEALDSYVKIGQFLTRNSLVEVPTAQEVVLLLRNVTETGRVLLFQMKITSTIFKLEERFLCQNRSVFNQEFVGRSPDSTRGRTFAK